jgi:tetratricopeptide (TPR) repeat protein
VLVPEHRTGVVVLANSNTVATSLVAMAALDVALAETAPSEGAEAEQGDDGLRGLASLRPPIARRVAEVLVADGPEAATATYRQLVAEDPARYDLDDEGFADAVWGAIELHRTDLVWPLLQLWTVLRPESSAVWTMTGWAHHVDGDTVEARRLLERALELDPDNADATLILGTLPR